MAIRLTSTYRKIRKGILLAKKWQDIYESNNLYHFGSTIDDDLVKKVCLEYWKRHAPKNTNIGSKGANVWLSIYCIKV